MNNQASQPCLGEFNAGGGQDVMVISLIVSVSPLSAKADCPIQPAVPRLFCLKRKSSFRQGLGYIIFFNFFNFFLFSLFVWVPACPDRARPSRSNLPTPTRSARGAPSLRRCSQTPRSRCWSWRS